MKYLCAGMGLILLAGCSGGKPDEAAGAAANAAANMVNAATEALPAAPTLPARDVVIERNDKALEFSYEWPAVASSIAPLNKWLQSHADTQFADAHKEAVAAQKDAKANDYPYRTYSYDQEWEAVANTPAVLVLEGQGGVYTGGAHGMPFVSTIIWDRKAGKRLALRNVIDTEKLLVTSKDRFCKELDKQREEKRGEPVDPDAEGGIPEFNQCPVMTEQEIIPVARKGGASLDALLIVIGPYVAGSYAEGNYEITLPMTSAMMGAVKPAYKGWFTVAR